MPQGYWDILLKPGNGRHAVFFEESIPVCHRPFLLVSEASAKGILVIPAELVIRSWMPTFAKAAVGDRSTGSKQTLNGLFYVYQPELFSLSSEASAKEDPSLCFRIIKLRDSNYLNQFIRTKFGQSGAYYALISTSTPLGRSSLLSASTVRLEEV